METSTILAAVLIAILSFVVGAITGFFLNRTIERNTRQQAANSHVKMEDSFKAAANEFLSSAQTSLIASAKLELGTQSEAQRKELQAKEELIDRRLQDTNASLTALKTQIDAFDGNQAAMLGKFSTDFTRSAEETLMNAQETLIKLANERLKSETTENKVELESKRQIIDQRLNDLNSTLDKVRTLIQDFDSKQEVRITSLDTQISSLTQTTKGLEHALKDNRARGRLGEQIAESVLELCGLSKGIDYLVQQTIEGEDGNNVRPDFTFLLPNDYTLNMDSKFPLDNYMSYLQADSETDQKTYKEKFLRTDIRGHIKKITGKAYINPEQNTLDYVLLFIPSEPIYRFLLDEDDSVFKEALSSHVVLCSPLTLYSIVQVIRQSARNYRVEKNSREILTLLATFTRKWEMYVEEMDKIGKSLDAARVQYDYVVGTRTHMLQLEMNKANRLLIKTAKDDEAIIATEGVSEVIEVID